MASLIDDVEALLTQMQSCFDILVPDLRMGLEAFDQGHTPPHATSSSHKQQLPPSSGGDLEDSEDEGDIEWEEVDLGWSGGTGSASGLAR